MGMDINNDVSYQNYYTNVQPASAVPETSKTSGNNVNQSSNVPAQNITPADVAAVQKENAHKIPSVYEQNQSRIALEEEVDKLIKQIMPDMGVKFKIHDSGAIITSVINNSTKEVVREFPAEKMLDIVYNMCTKLGIIAKKRI